MATDACVFAVAYGVRRRVLCACAVCVYVFRVPCTAFVWGTSVLGPCTAGGPQLLRCCIRCGVRGCGGGAGGGAGARRAPDACALRVVPHGRGRGAGWCRGGKRAAGTCAALAWPPALSCVYVCVSQARDLGRCTRTVSVVRCSWVPRVAPCLRARVYVRFPEKVGALADAEGQTHVCCASAGAHRQRGTCCLLCATERTGRSRACLGPISVAPVACRRWKSRQQPHTPEGV